MLQSVSVSVAAHFCTNPTDFERLVSEPGHSVFWGLQFKHNSCHYGYSLFNLVTCVVFITPCK